jgi:hypothetical protein
MKVMTAYTPGPWNVEGTLWLQDGKLHEEYPDNDRGAEYLVNVGTDDAYIAICYGEENARLIAAAPELLEALEELCRYLANDERYYQHQVVQEARAAIAKARA